jgi:hypothetical protein
MLRALVAAALMLASCTPPTAATFPNAPRTHDPLDGYQVANDTQYGAPRQLLARPWQMGQWATYKRREGTNVTVETVRLLALDNCGVWLEYASDDGRYRRSWLFCVRGPAAPEDTQLYETLWSVVERRGAAIVAYHNFRRGSEDRMRFAWLPALVHAAWPGLDEADREDLVVPSGHFAQTVKTTEAANGVETTRWSHPAVPLGGLVREVSGDRERVLLAFGYSRRRSVLLETIDEVAEEAPRPPKPMRELADTECAVGVRLSPMICQRSPSLFVRFAFGLGGVSRNGDVAPGSDWSWSMQFGQRLGYRLHLVEEMNVLGAGLTLTPRLMTEEHLSVGAGVRWVPFEPNPHRGPTFPFAGSYIDMHAFTLTAVVGANMRDRLVMVPATTRWTEEVDWSPMASIAIGLLQIGGRDWTLGPEFREQLTRYDGRFQRGWQLLFATHLNRW